MIHYDTGTGLLCGFQAPAESTTLAERVNCPACLACIRWAEGARRREPEPRTERAAAPA